MTSLMLALILVTQCGSNGCAMPATQPGVNPYDYRYSCTGSDGLTFYGNDAKSLADYVGSLMARAVVPPGQLPTIAQGDPYGFVAWLNDYRRRSGRWPVSHDPNLSAWAHANNASQAARRGMGHNVMGTARRQNSGQGSAQAVWNLWTISPAHNDALLDPSIKAIGIASSNGYWTYNAN